MKYLPCEFRQQLGAPVARASSVKTSNIGTLDALAGSVKQPFMQSAAKSDSEPTLPDAARRKNVSCSRSSWPMLNCILSTATCEPVAEHFVTSPLIGRQRMPLSKPQASTHRLHADLDAAIVRALLAALCGLPPSSGPVSMLVHGRPLVYRDDAFGRWWTVSQCAVRPDRIVVATPFLDEDLGLIQAVEDLTIQKFGLR